LIFNADRRYYFAQENPLPKGALQPLSVEYSQEELPIDGALMSFSVFSDLHLGQLISFVALTPKINSSNI
jgi:hypothetical protein